MPDGPLEGPGSKERLERVKRGFKRASFQREWSRSLGRNLLILLLAAAALAYVLWRYLGDGRL